MNYYSSFNVNNIKEDWSDHFLDFFKNYCPGIFYNRLGYNKNITMKVIYKLLDSNITDLQKHNLCTHISSNYNITYKDYKILIENYNVKFNSIDLVHNRNLPLEFLKIGILLKEHLYFYFYW